MIMFLVLTCSAYASSWMREAARCYGQAKVEWLDSAPSETPQTFWCEVGGIGFSLKGKVQSRRLKAKINALSLREAGLGTEALHEGDVEPITVDLTERKWFLDRDQLASVETKGQRLRSFFPKGHVIRRQDMKPVPLVKRGTLVPIWVQSGAVSVKQLGLMEQDGLLGQEVSVKLGSKRLTGRVEAHGAVVVHL